MCRNALELRCHCEGLLRRYSDTEHVPAARALLGQSLHEWGFVEEAQVVRDKLAEESPGSSWLRDLDRALARPPGTMPDEKVFIRPYRIRQVPGLPGG